MEDNKYSELLTYYLDGELAPEQEQELFTALAGNPDLESELSDMLTIRNSVRQEVNAGYVPAEATDAVFKAIGIGAAHTVATPEGTSRESFYGRRIIRYASVILLIGAMIYLFITNTDKESKIENLQNQLADITSKLSENKANPANGIQPAGNENHSQNGYPVVSSFDSNKPLQSEPRAKSISINNEKHQKNINPIEPEEFYYKKVPAEFGESKIAGQNTEFYGSKRTELPGRNYRPSISSGFTELLHSSTNGNYMVSLRGVNPNSYPAQKFSIAMPVFSNLGIGIYRSFKALSVDGGLIGDVKIGFEFGQEPFAQEFYVNKQGQTNIRKQNPLLFWCTAACRVDFTPNVVFDELKPYSQIEIGGTQIGPIVKLQAGLNFDIAGGFGVQAGIEGSSLLFKNQTEWYSSEKISIFYGMTLKF